MLDVAFWVGIGGMVTGAGALVWNFYDYQQRQAGFMKLKLRCKCENVSGWTYIVSKTTIENFNNGSYGSLHSL
jgi:hypothetical protein